MPQKLNYSDTTPAAPAGSKNIAWAADAPSADPTIVRNISAHVAEATATTDGLVPTPPNDITKFLRGDATFAIVPVATATVKGLVPTPPNDPTKFLRGDATFATVPAASTAAPGLVQLDPLGDATKALKGDGTWGTVASSGGGIASAVPPDAPPASPTVYDDEFNGAVLDATKWTYGKAGTSTAVYSLKNGEICSEDLPALGTASNHEFVNVTAHVSGREYTAKFHSVGGGASTGMVFADGSKSYKFGAIASGSATGQLFIFHGTGTPTVPFSAFVATDVNINCFVAATYYLKIKDDGVNLVFWYSVDGITWRKVGSVGRTAYLPAGPNAVGFILDTNDVNSCEWFRRTDLGYTPQSVLPPATPDSTPLVAGTLDDEFNGLAGVVPSAFSWVNQGTCTVQQDGQGAAIFIHPAFGTSATDWALFLKAVPAAPWEVTCKWTFAPDAGTNFTFAGVCVRDSVSAKFLTFHIDSSLGMNVSGYTNPSTYGGYNPATGTIDTGGAWPLKALRIGGAFYFRVKDDGANLIFSYSVDGGHTYRAWATVARTAFMTNAPNQVGICCGTQINGVRNVATFDWFRRTL